MDGDLAPLPELAQAARAARAWLAVDDAHGLGVVGTSGGGTLEHFGLDAEAVPVLVGTLGKAFGCFGAFVAGSRALIEYLMQKARTYIYTTALPQPVAAATRAALRAGADRGLAPRAGPASSPRASAAPRRPAASRSRPPQRPSSRCCAAARGRRSRRSRRWRQRGFWVGGHPPADGAGGCARLRVTLSAAHTEREVEALAEALAC